MALKLTRRGMLTGTAVGLAGFAAFPVMAQDKAPSGPPPVELFAASPAIGQIALSPDGLRVALITERKGQKYLGYFEIATMKIQAAPIGDVKVLNMAWGDNENIVYVVSKARDTKKFRVGLIEQGMAYCYNIRDKSNVSMFGNDNQVDDAELGCDSTIERLLIGGKYYVYMKYVSSHCVIARFCLAEAKSEAVLINEGWFEDWEISSDGKKVFATTFTPEDSVWELYYLDAQPSARFAGPVLRIRTKDDDPALLGWAEDGASVIVSQSAGEGREYFEVSPKGKRGKTLDADKISFGKTAFFNPKTRQVAGFRRHDDWFSYDCFDPFMAQLVKAVPQKLEPDARWAFADFAEDPRKLLVYTESATDSGAYFFLDFSNGDAKFVAENYPELPVEWLTEKKPIDYLAADGLKIHAYLTLPPQRDAKNLPLVVLPHGGPEARDFVDFDWQVQALASRGYAVLQPNFRGSSGYGAAFSDAGHGQWGRKMQTDLSDGVRELVKQGLVDPKRVAIVGASYGGYAALAGATLDQGVYKCAVSVAGVADLEYFTRYEKRRYGHVSSTSYYWSDYLGPSANFNEISPLRQASRAYCPILLIHGKDDTVVPFLQSDEMNKALKAAGKTVEFIPFEGQDHWETNETARIAMMKAVVAFLQKYNPA